MRECTWIRCPCSGEEDVLFEVGDVVSNHYCLFVVLLAIDYMSNLQLAIQYGVTL